MSQVGGQGTQSSPDEYVDLVAVEAAEAEGDDVAIVVDPPEPPPSRRGLVIALVAAGAVVVLLIVGAVIAFAADDNDRGDEVSADVGNGTDDDVELQERPVRPSLPETPAPIVIEPAPVEAPVAETPAVEEPAPPPRATPAPQQPAPQVEAPAATPAPAPTPAQLSASAASVTVPSGQSVVSVSLSVHNSGGTAGTYVYDNDSCDPWLVNPPGVYECAQVVRSFDVPPGATITHRVSVYVGSPSPGQYTVPIGDTSVTIVVV